MRKSHRNRSNIVKSLTKTASNALPIVDKGLKKVGSTAKKITSASIPIIEKGVSAVYGTMATGLDLGVKGAKSVFKRSRSRNIGRSRSLTGGRRRHTRRHRKRH